MRKDTQSYLAEIEAFLAEREATAAAMRRRFNSKPRLVSTSGRVTVSNRPRPTLTLVIGGKHDA